MKPGTEVVVQVKSYMRRRGVFVKMIRSPLWVREANKAGMGYPRWCYVQFKRLKNPSRVMFSTVRKAD